MQARKLYSSGVVCLVLLAGAFVPATSLGQSNDQANEQATDQESIIANPDSRFTIERDGEGFVRLDKKTGETSFCCQLNSNLVCRLAIEERAAFDTEISDLQDKLVALQEKFDSVADGISPDPSLSRPKENIPDTSQKEGAGSERDQFEQELDRALDITKKTMRRLFSVVKELQKEFNE